jgi:hypothetical protein
VELKAFAAFTSAPASNESPHCIRRTNDCGIHQQRDLARVHGIGADSLIEYYFQSAQVARANDRVNLVAIGVRGLERRSEPKGGRTGNICLLSMSIELSIW